MPKGKGPQKRRMFVSINLPRKLQVELFKIQKKIVDEGFSMKLVPAENLHITIVFLGEQGEIGLRGAKEAIYRAAKKIRKFRALANRLLIFEDEKKVPKLLVLNVVLVSELKYFLKYLTEELKNLGVWYKEYPSFVPHITLAKFVDGESIDKRALKRAISGKLEIYCEAEQVDLMESLPAEEGEGRVYESLYSVKFKAQKNL